MARGGKREGTGPKPEKPGHSATKTLGINLSPDEIALIRFWATEEGKTPSAWGRDVLRREIAQKLQV